MRLSVSHHFKTPGKRGLQKFGRLLIKELSEKFDVKMVEENAKPDINLTIISGAIKPRAKNVLRLDGVYYDSGRAHMNTSIKRSVQSFDGVVFQSKWCKKFVTTMLKVQPKHQTVVYNGVNQFKSQKVPPMPHNFDQAFVCCAHWRINKRLQSIVHSFLAVNNRSDLNLGLFVIGKPDYVHKHPNIVYLGDINKVAPVYAASNYMCHICHLDACPNSVIEGLSLGLPVLSNNIGGTPEIVGKSGVIVDIDPEFDFRYIKKMNQVGPVSVDNELLEQGMESLLSREWKIKRPDLDISHSAKGYYDFFVSLLR